MFKKRKRFTRTKPHYRKSRINLAPSRTNDAVRNGKGGRRFWKRSDFAWRCLEILGVFAAIWALWSAIEANRLARAGLEIAIDEAKEGRIINAWQVITTVAPGTSGKKEALETLLNAGISLEALDLSCDRMEGGWDPKELECDYPVKLTNLRVQSEKNTRLEFANFSGVDLTGADLSNAELKRIDLSGAILEGTNFSGADLGGANLSGARLQRTDFTEANMLGVNLSGAYFCDHLGCDTIISQEQLDEAWTWADNPADMGFFFDHIGDIFRMELKPPRTCAARLRTDFPGVAHWASGMCW